MIEFWEAIKRLGGFEVMDLNNCSDEQILTSAMDDVNNLISVLAGIDTALALGRANNAASLLESYKQIMEKAGVSVGRGKRTYYDRIASELENEWMISIPSVGANHYQT